MTPRRAIEGQLALGLTPRPPAGAFSCADELAHVLSSAIAASGRTRDLVAAEMFACRSRQGVIMTQHLRRLRRRLITARLARAGWTITQLGRELGVSRQYVQQVLSGARPGLMVRLAIASRLGMAPSRMWDIQRYRRFEAARWRRQEIHYTMRLTG